MRNSLFLMSKVPTSDVRFDTFICDGDERKLKVAHRLATPNAYSGEAQSHIVPPRKALALATFLRPKIVWAGGRLMPLIMRHEPSKSVTSKAPRPIRSKCFLDQKTLLRQSCHRVTEDFAYIKAIMRRFMMHDEFLPRKGS